jgi:hypothetical protein
MKPLSNRARQREALYLACRGDNEVPDCNLCGLPIAIGQDWDNDVRVVLFVRLRAGAALDDALAAAAATACAARELVQCEQGAIGMIEAEVDPHLAIPVREVT